jgi:hypothetical protein
MSSITWKEVILASHFPQAVKVAEAARENTSKISQTKGYGPEYQEAVRKSCDASLAVTKAFMAKRAVDASRVGT